MVPEGTCDEIAAVDGGSRRFDRPLISGAAIDPNAAACPKDRADHWNVEHLFLAEVERFGPSGRSVIMTAGSK